MYVPLASRIVCEPFVNISIGYPGSDSWNALSMVRRISCVEALECRRHTRQRGMLITLRGLHVSATTLLPPKSPSTFVA